MKAILSNLEISSHFIIKPKDRVFLNFLGGESSVLSRTISNITMDGEDITVECISDFGAVSKYDACDLDGHIFKTREDAEKYKG